jgi:inorganic pyrophosphatase
MIHPWHSVHYGDESPAIVNAIVEIPEQSRAKYELDKETGLLKLDRVLYSAVYYPANYGFIPRTLGDDKDPLDIVIISQVAIQPLCMVRAQVLGVMRMIDNGEEDDKILAVAADDISVNHITNVDQLPPHFTKELQQFFEEYKRLERKTVNVEGFQPRSVAFRIIDQSIKYYQEVFATETIKT